MKTLETDRLILRSWLETDLDDFYEYSKSPNVGPRVGWEPHSSREASLSVLKNFIEKDNGWAIENKSDQKVIGAISLYDDPYRPGLNAKTIGYALSERYWGQGLMPEVVRRVLAYLFEECGYDLVSAYHYPFNQQSRRVIEKCGFQYDGTLRRARKIYDGSIYNACCYSMLKSEYREELP